MDWKKLLVLVACLCKYGTFKWQCCGINGARTIKVWRVYAFDFSCVRYKEKSELFCYITRHAETHWVLSQVFLFPCLFSSRWIFLKCPTCKQTYK